MLNFDATAPAFIDFSFAQLQKLKITQLQYACSFTIVDGRVISFSFITNTVLISFAIGSYVKPPKLFVTKPANTLSFLAYFSFQNITLI